jgi:hypothetical protein
MYPSTWPHWRYGQDMPRRRHGWLGAVPERSAGGGGVSERVKMFHSPERMRVQETGLSWELSGFSRPLIPVLLVGCGARGS